MLNQVMLAIFLPSLMLIRVIGNKLPGFSVSLRSFVSFANDATYLFSERGPWQRLIFELWYSVHVHQEMALSGSHRVTFGLSRECYFVANFFVVQG